MVIGVALVVAVVAVWLLAPWKGERDDCRGCAAQNGEDPGGEGAAIDPGRPDPPSSLAWHRQGQDAVLSWEVKNAQAGDQYVWWVEGAGLKKQSKQTEATSVKVAKVGAKAVCAEVSVSRQGRTSDANRECFGAEK